MSSSPTAEPASPPTPLHASTPNYVGKKQQQQLSVVLPPTPVTPPTTVIPGEPTLTPPPRSPGLPPACPSPGPATPVTPATPACQQPDGTSSDKSSETAAQPRGPSSAAALTRKESYKAQRQNYRREKKRAASALLHCIDEPVLADWLKVRGSLKSWTKLWCVLKPGLLLLYKSPKAKSSHWVGTVLLTSCQVIERPSKKDGFCFKLYHPLEQSIWAPRGPHNETIGAVVQPFPTAHLIFRAPSQAAGHCWLDGLELALRCSNAMLRCSQPRVEAAADVSQPSLSHEELEKHFNEHEKSKPKRKLTKWSQFVESIEFLSKENSSDSEERDSKEHGFLDFLRKKEIFDRNAACTSSMRVTSELKNVKLVSNPSKSLASSPAKNAESIVRPIFKYFDKSKLQLPLGEKNKIEIPRTMSPNLPILEENLLKLVTSFPKRRSSTPSIFKTLTQKRVNELRISGAKTDSENDDFLKRELPKKRKLASKEILCTTPDNFMITKTAPSMERFRKYSSSSTDEIDRDRHVVFKPSYEGMTTPDKFSLIDYRHLPSASFAARSQLRIGDRLSAQNVYVAGQIVRASELAGAASESDSEGSRVMSREPKRKDDVLARLQREYEEDPDREIGAAGELVEEVAEENKSLLWFLLKQVRPGMDLSKVVLPTFILEPRSFLDKLSDSYYHADILAQARKIQDPYQRFKCVLRWYLSGLYRKPKGLKKPYNPVLGETFRCCWRHGETTTYYVAEQVSHHPPISAFYVSNRKEGFVIQGSLLARSKFYGNSTSAILEGCARVHLLPFGETYITTAPYAHCKGIVIGTLSMELGGKVQVICNETGYQAEVEFKLRSFLGGADQTNAISGRIKKGKDTVATVEGYWDGRIDIKDKKTGEESNLLDCAVLKNQRLQRYLVKLDLQHEHESQKLWLKVSEAIANDDQVAATEQKTIVEEAQRTRTKNQTTPWIPRIFHKDSNSNLVPPEGILDQAWQYNHVNTDRWHDEEILEYEDDFVIKSLGKPAPAPAASLQRVPGSETARTSEKRDRDLTVLRRTSDSDDYDDRQRHSKTSTRTLKQSLYAIDTTLREQSAAIERLTRAVEAINDTQRNQASVRPLNLGGLPATSHFWDLFGGFVLAIVLQALLKWIFYRKD